MKSLKFLWMPGLVALMFLLGAGKAAAQAGPRASFQTFYDELEPYGRWMTHPRYGYVWLPDAGPDFQPYATDGHWVVTEYGNTWVSDYAWGWAPFHYGRWFFDEAYGWTWVPDQEWGPAWVSWRNGGGYYGWAPLGPGMGLSRFDIPVNHWYFVPEIYIGRPRIFTFCVPRTRIVYVYHQTHHLNNIYRYQNRDYAYGPRRQDIERATRNRVYVYRLDQDDRPGRSHIQDRSVRIYRPEVYNDQQERYQPRSLAGRGQGNDRYDASRDRNSAGTVGRREDRSAGSSRSSVQPDRGNISREEIRISNQGTSSREDYTIPSRGTAGRDYPGNGTQPQERVISRESSSQRNYPAAAPAGTVRERGITNSRNLREQPASPGTPQVTRERAPAESYRGRVSRTPSGEPASSGVSQVQTREVQTRRESATTDQGVRPAQVQRDRPSEGVRGSRGQRE